HGMTATTSFDGALRRRELAERIRAAAIVLVPSHSETFGLVALEASASGVPVVARASGGLREAVVDGETGILVSGDDPAPWAEAIMRVLGNQQLADDMRDAARRHALTRSWDASPDRLLAVYDEVLES